MARKARIISESGYYHVMLRGVNRQKIFYDPEDNERWLGCLRRFSRELEIDICAYCLMGNHVHLLLRAFSGMDLLIRKMGASYVYYFNRKYDRVGHLFQGRFRSEPVDSDFYLMIVFRYILRNPYKAGFSGIQNYKWSSWSELEGNRGFCEFDEIIQIAGSLDGLKHFVLEDNDDECLEYSGRRSFSDENAVKIIQKLTGIKNPEDISFLKKSEQKTILPDLIKEGLSITQLSRLTGISRYCIKESVLDMLTMGDSPYD